MFGMSKQEQKLHERQLSKAAAKVAAQTASLSEEQKQSVTESLQGIWMELQGAQDPDQIPPAEQMVSELADLTAAVERMDEGIRARDLSLMAAIDRQTEAYLKLQDSVVALLHQRSKT